MRTAVSEVATESRTVDESGRLVELERTIEHGLATFIEVGEALTEIRDSRLYRIEYDTFEDYCREKWKMSDRRARQLMDASSVVETIGKSGTIVPKCESQIRPITKLEPEQRFAAWNDAVEKTDGKQPTSRQVEQAVIALLPSGDGKTRRRATERKGQTKHELIRKPYTDLKNAWDRAIDLQRKHLLKAILRGPRYAKWLLKELSKIEGKDSLPNAINPVAVDPVAVDPVARIFDQLREQALLSDVDLATELMRNFVLNERGEVADDRARTLLRSCPTYYDSPLTLLLKCHGDNVKEIVERLLGLRAIDG